MIFINNRWPVLAGLTIGAIFSILRLSSTAVMLERILSEKTPFSAARTSIIRFAVTLLAAIAILAASASLDVWIFGGAAAGMLLVPLVVMANGLTEGLGLTRNNWTGKDGQA